MQPCDLLAASIDKDECDAMGCLPNKLVEGQHRAAEHASGLAQYDIYSHWRVPRGKAWFEARYIFLGAQL